MNEADYLMKNYGDRGGCWPRRITPSEIVIILHMIRKPNSIIVLLFFQKLLFRLVPAAVLNLETSEVSNIVRLLKIGFSKVKVKVIAHQVRAENLGLWLT